jgi:hypothetical protein
VRGYNLTHGTSHNSYDRVDNRKDCWGNIEEVVRLGKSLKDREAKQQVDEIADKVRELKQSASELEDENRELRGMLRFKSDAYEFRSPFWYDKAQPSQPLCAKCFAGNVAPPMGAQGQDCNPDYRRCLAIVSALKAALHEHTDRLRNLAARKLVN